MHNNRTSPPPALLLLLLLLVEMVAAVAGMVLEEVADADADVGVADTADDSVLPPSAVSLAVSTTFGGAWVVVVVVVVPLYSDSKQIGHVCCPVVVGLKYFTWLLPLPLLLLVTVLFLLLLLLLLLLVPWV